MKKFIIFFVAGAVLLLCIFWYYRYFQSTGFRVVFFNVGQGDSALIQFGNGEKMLVDCGPDKKILAKLGEYLPFYDRTIDYLMITHPDGDHYGGCVDVLKRYEVKNIIQNGMSKEDDAYWQVWDEKVKAENADLETISEHQILTIGDSKLELFSPDESLNLPDKYKDSNNLSIVFKLFYKDKTFLFTGDAEIPLENALIAKYCASSTPCPSLQAMYLKAGHHGSDSSSGDGFISAVAPNRAIVSVGKNTFGHPSLRVMRHLERAPIDILRTDQKNDIIIK